MKQTPTSSLRNVNDQDADLCLDLETIWKSSAGLDLSDRTVLEAEVLIWRICTARAARLARRVATAS